MGTVARGFKIPQAEEIEYEKIPSKSQKMIYLLYIIMLYRDESSSYVPSAMRRKHENQIQ